MKLSEFLNTIPYDKMLYLGAQVGFLFGGTKLEFLEALDGLNMTWKSWAEENLDTAKVRYEDLLGKHGEKNRFTREAKRKMENLSEAFIPFEDRDIIDIFNRTYDDAVNIIVSGVEPGKMWDVKEGTEEWKRCVIKYNEDALAEAIISMVVSDYKTKLVKELKEFREILNKLDEYRCASAKLEDYFRSDGFKAFLSVDPEYVISEVRKQVAEMLEER